MNRIGRNWGGIHAFVMALGFSAPCVILAQTSDTTISVSRVRTNIDSVDRIKSILITPVSQQDIRRAIDTDEKWRRSEMINGERVTFLAGAYEARIQNIVSRLLRAVDIDSAQWSVRIVDTSPKIENAFVIGGKIIYVYTGLIDAARNDDELAFVLGHEIGHTLLKHIQRNVEDPNSALLNSIAQLGGLLAKSQNTREAFSIGSDIITSAYSRDHEREADAFAAYITTKAGYQYRGGVSFFYRLIRQGKARDAQNDQQLAAMAQSARAQLDSCEQQKQKYNSSPLYRTQQNANIVNQICSQAIELATRTNQSIGDFRKGVIKEIFTRTHPLDEERVLSIRRVDEWMACRLNEESVAKIGVGYFVLKALDFEPSCK